MVVFALSGRLIAFCARLFAGLEAVLRWGLMASDPPLWATTLTDLERHDLRRRPCRRNSFPDPRSARASRRRGLGTLRGAGLVLSAGTMASGPLYRIFTGEAYVAMALLALWELAVLFC